MSKKEKTIEEKYKVLDQISHVLLRPGTYVGSNKPNTSLKWIIENNKMIKKEITIIPSFLKIIDEINVCYVILFNYFVKNLPSSASSFADAETLTDKLHPEKKGSSTKEIS